ncbi:hypothetical protein Mmc1_3246 [Magnetococcus marinus MC-1]|uniref:Uncharacterized protein n=1 Tax=Magnetococcus marinus (strain ATCC BAA-1437 / JCM 17883 / MC-1) TaxID=156889 RepID=A0LCP3_MAGMM|nr:hypothetical protein Mmc1_3246 [Magnetococcus marinus MC-1]
MFFYAADNPISALSRCVTTKWAILIAFQYKYNLILKIGWIGSFFWIAVGNLFAVSAAWQAVFRTVLREKLAVSELLGIL